VVRQVPECPYARNIGLVGVVDADMTVIIKVEAACCRVKSIAIGFTTGGDKECIRLDRVRPLERLECNQNSPFDSSTPC
jgi:hypothetical protein